MFLVFIAVSGAIEKNLFTFSTKTIRKCSYTSDKKKFLHDSSAKNDYKNWLKNTLENIWYSVHRNVQFQWQLQ